MAKTKNKKSLIANEHIRTLVKAGSMTKLSEVFEMAKLTNVASGTKLHYSALSRYKNNPGTIKAEIFVVLSEYFEMPPQDLFQLALNDIGFKS